MAIRYDIEEGHPNLFCDSKFWGSPDLPDDMPYPMLDERPLTFLCQISCYDIHEMDTEGILPDDGMLYFFADIDGLFGSDSCAGQCAGEWLKGHAVVKYTKTVNMETFQSVILLDEEDKPIAQKAQPLKFSVCADSFAGMRMLGEAPDGFVNLLQLPLDPSRTLNFLIKDSDLNFGNWKKAKLVMTEK